MTVFGREGQGEGQGQRADAQGSVEMAEFASHSSGSAVNLVHLKRATQPALGRTMEGESAGRSPLKSGCYHTRSVNVL